MVFEHHLEIVSLEVAEERVTETFCFKNAEFNAFSGYQMFDAVLQFSEELDIIKGSIRVSQNPSPVSELFPFPNMQNYAKKWQT